MTDFGVEAQISSETTPAAEAEFTEQKLRIRDAIQGLPAQQKQVVEMFYQKGLNQKTIAKQLKLSRPKVCRLLARAVDIIRAKLKHG